MAKPAFIIAAKERIEDKATNALSMIHILENVQLEVSEEFELTPGNISGIEMEAWIFGVWCLDEGDFGANFRRDFTFLSPSGSHDIRIAMDDFVIGGTDATTKFTRTALRIHNLPVFPEPGMWKLQMRISRVDQPDIWAVQSVPLNVAFGERYTRMVRNAPPGSLIAQYELALRTEAFSP